MKNALVFTIIGLAAVPAFAQEPTFALEPGSAQEIAAPGRPRPAVERALEITVGAGYAQGFGDISGSQRSLTDLGSAGGELSLGVGYRLDRRFLVGAYGSGSKYSTGDFASGADIWSATAGVQANVHFLPDNDWDPWLALGTGWRGYWVKKTTGTDSRHGWDIARLQVGVDYRLSPEFALSPYVGTGLTTFFTQELAGEQSFSNVRSPNVNVWVSAGLQGRFDLFGTSAPAVRLATAN